MAQIPHELIRRVQIRTRAAAGLPDYGPSDPTPPAPLPLSATIAASDPSSPDRRCRNCNALLLRGSESILCLYCGIGPHYDAVPDPISFTSTVGYRWLLHSLRLDGSEMVDPTSKSKLSRKQISPQDLTPLSVFLDIKIPGPAETVDEDISSDKYLGENKRSSILPGVAPDRFFLKSMSKDISNTVIEQPSDHDSAGTASTKDVAALGNQDFFQHVESSSPAVSSSEQKTSEDFSGWEADFQFADTEDQPGGRVSSEHVPASSEGSENIIREPESFQSSSGLNVDLSAHLDSVFGPGENLNDGKPKDSPSVPPAVGDWNSDDMWNNRTSSARNLADGFDTSLNDQTLGHSGDLSTSADLFQDFQSQTNYADMTKNKATNEEHTAMDEDIFDDWNDFASSTSLQAPSQNAWAGSNDQVLISENKASEGDFFSFDNKLEGDVKFEDDKKSSERDLFSFDNKLEDDKKSSEGDFFSFDNKLEGDRKFDKKSSEKDLFSFDNKSEDDKKSSERDLFSFDNKSEDDKKSSERDLFSFDNKSEDGKKSSERDLFSFDNKSEDDKKSSERDLFSFDNKFEGGKNSSDNDLFSFDNSLQGDFGGDPQTNLLSSSNSNAPAEGESTMSTNDASNWFSDMSNPSLESGQAANNGDAEDHVKMLISQMHDLSFMLETDLSIPSNSENHKSVQKD